MRFMGLRIPRISSMFILMLMKKGYYVMHLKFDETFVKGGDWNAHIYYDCFCKIYVPVFIEARCIDYFISVLLYMSCLVLLQ